MPCSSRSFKIFNWLDRHAHTRTLTHSVEAAQLGLRLVNGLSAWTTFWLRSNSRMLVFNLLLKLTKRIPCICVHVCVFGLRVKPQNNNLAAICYNMWQWQLQMINNVCDIVVKSIILSYILGALLLAQAGPTYTYIHALNIKCSTATHNAHNIAGIYGN